MTSIEVILTRLLASRNIEINVGDNAGFGANLTLYLSLNLLMTEIKHVHF